MERNLWRARLEGKMNSLVAEYLSCLSDDERIFEIDVRLNQAYCLALFKAGYVKRDEAIRILEALEKLKSEKSTGKFSLQTYLKKGLHDVHPIIEEYVIETCGLDIGGKIHLGKSRNDQVMTDLLIYARDKTIEISLNLTQLIETLLRLVRRNKGYIMPAYTHSLPAQVTTIGHYMLSYVSLYLRDLERMIEVYKRLNKCPLGSSAIAGSSINLDRHFLAELLGFDGIIPNTMDATSNRDTILELASVFAIFMNNLSRMAADIISWSSYEVRMLEIPDEFADISTAMPQKKNPCPLELLRAKAAETGSLLNGLFSIIAALPSGYHRDLQEAKSILFKIIDLVQSSLKVMQELVPRLKVNKKRMTEIATTSNVTAIDLSEYIVRKLGIPFRRANQMVGEIIKDISRRGKHLANLSDKEIRMISRKFFQNKVAPWEFRKVVNPYFAIKNRKSTGGPGWKSIQTMLLHFSKELNKNKKMVFIEKRKLDIKNNRLTKQIIDLCQSH